MTAFWISFNNTGLVRTMGFPTTPIGIKEYLSLISLDLVNINLYGQFFCSKSTLAR